MGALGSGSVSVPPWVVYNSPTHSLSRLLIRPGPQRDLMCRRGGPRSLLTTVTTVDPTKTNQTRVIVLPLGFLIEIRNQPRDQTNKVFC